MKQPFLFSRSAFLLLAASSAILACSGNQPLVSQARTEQIHVSSQFDDINLAFSSRSDLSSDTLSASAERVFAILPAAYAELKLPIAAFDTATRTIAGGTVTARRQFGGKPLSDYLDCGSSATGRNANQYEVRFNVVSRATAETKDRSQITMLVSARAAGDGGQGVRCSSNGRLENLLVETLRRKLSG